ncbi:LicD family protein [Candidatus Woesearchaeota archaeon]|nr:LicD family protein [Candidatus Woesearchaeota archaeon]
MNEKNAAAVLKEVDEVFKKHNVTYWLDSGTLLAAVRDKKFIPWDNDIDLGIWSHEVVHFNSSNKLFKELGNKGFQIYVLKDKIVLEKKKILVNVSVFYLRKRVAFRSLLTTKSVFGKLFKAWWWTFSVINYNSIRSRNFFNLSTLIKHFLLFWVFLFPNDCKASIKKFISKVSCPFGCEEINWVVPAHYFKNFSSLSFYGVSFNVPRSLKSYLVFRYGKNWCVTQKNWITFSDDGAIGKS